MSNNHISVLPQEVLYYLDVKPGAWYIDCTFGTGGHTKNILDKGGCVLAFDFDAHVIELAKKKFEKQIGSKKLVIVRENFSKLTEIVKQKLDTQKQKNIRGILFDFGTSSDQLKNVERGFSFEGDGQLDMRMDERLGVKAKDLLALLSIKQLTNLFLEYGGENYAKVIAKTIVKQRKQGRLITTNKQLSDLITKIKGGRKGRLHPATKVFQALRIAVNSELDNIEDVLPQVVALLRHESRVVAISFHEGEDRLVKQTFKKWQQNGKGKILTPKPVTPSDAEINNNKRAHSSKLRTFKIK